MSRKLLVACLVGAIASTTLVLGLDRPQVVYAYSVSHFLKEPQRDTEVRLGGWLVHGSLCRVREPCEYRFRLKGESGEQLPVRYPQCVVPDTFRDVPGIDVSITVQGELCGNCHTFTASSIFAKCASYDISLGRSVPSGPPPECPP